MIFQRAAYPKYVTAVLALFACLMASAPTQAASSQQDAQSPALMKALQQQTEIIELFRDTFAANGNTRWDVSSDYQSYCITGTTKGCQAYHETNDNFTSAYKTFDTDWENDYGIHYIQTKMIEHMALAYTNVLGNDIPEFSITALGMPTSPLIVSGYDAAARTVTFEISAAPYKTTSIYLKKIKYHFIDKNHVTIEIHQYLSMDGKHPSAIEKLALTRINSGSGDNGYNH